MAEAKKGTEKKVNGGLVFESMGADYEIPTRVRSGAYDDMLEKLKGVKGVVCVFNSGENARPANTKRKALLTAAEKKGLDITASVRNISGKGNCLLVKFNGTLKAAKA